MKSFDLVSLDFAEGGHLASGIWNINRESFLHLFDFSPSRGMMLHSVEKIVDYAEFHAAKAILVGGSFASENPDPRDFDCVIVFASSRQIPPRILSSSSDDGAIDVFFASEDQPDVIASFVKMFSTNRRGKDVGIIRINLSGTKIEHWDFDGEPDKRIFEAVRSTYVNRHLVDRNPSKKALVTIHGIRTHADWNAEVTLTASAQGWLVAPFQYGYVNATVFLRSGQRDAIIDRFRTFLSSLAAVHGVETVSVIAHSLGTYIALKYITGFANPPTRFDTLILCGAIIREDFDFDDLRGKVGKVHNEIAPRDPWVRWAQAANLGRDHLFGCAGIRGFKGGKDSDNILSEETSDIFNHNNVIRNDVVSGRWMQRLTANHGCLERASTSKTATPIDLAGSRRSQPGGNL